MSDQCASGIIPACRIGERCLINRDLVLGDLLPQRVTLDERAAEKIVEAIKEMLVSGKSLALEKRPDMRPASVFLLVPLTGFEPAAFCSGGRRSIP